MRILVIVIVSLIPAQVFASHGGEGEIHINWFSADPESPPVGWFIINFVLFFGTLGYLTRRAVRNYFKNRYEAIKRQMEESLYLKNEAIKNLNEIQEKLNKIDEYAEAIKANYIDMAQKEKQEIIGQAKRVAQSLINSAEQTILFEANLVRQEIIREILMSAREKAMRDVISKYSKDRDRELIGEVIDSLDDIERKDIGYLV